MCCSSWDQGLNTQVSYISDTDECSSSCNGEKFDEKEQTCCWHDEDQYNYLTEHDDCNKEENIFTFIVDFMIDFFKENFSYNEDRAKPYWEKLQGNLTGIWNRMDDFERPVENIEMVWKAFEKSACLENLINFFKEIDEAWDFEENIKADGSLFPLSFERLMELVFELTVSNEYVDLIDGGLNFPRHWLNRTTAGDHVAVFNVTMNMVDAALGESFLDYLQESTDTLVSSLQRTKREADLEKVHQNYCSCEIGSEHFLNFPEQPEKNTCESQKFNVIREDNTIRPFHHSNNCAVGIGAHSKAGIRWAHCEHRLNETEIKREQVLAHWEFVPKTVGDGTVEKFGWIKSLDHDNRCWHMPKFRNGRVGEKVVLKNCKENMKQMFVLEEGSIWLAWRKESKLEQRYCLPFEGVGQKIRMQKCWSMMFA